MGLQTNVYDCQVADKISTCLSQKGANFIFNLDELSWYKLLLRKRVELYGTS